MTPALFSIVGCRICDDIHCKSKNRPLFQKLLITNGTSSKLVTKP